MRNFPNMLTVLTDHKADLVTATLPFAFDREKSLPNLVPRREVFGPADLSFWTARAFFVEKGRAAVSDVLEDHVQAIRWYMDPKESRRPCRSSPIP